MVVEIPFCKLNKKRKSIFRKRFNYFTNDSFDLNVVGKTKKVKSLFPLKDKNFHPSSKFSMAYVHPEKNTLQRPQQKFLYVMMNIISPLLSQKQLHLEKRNDHCFTWTISCNAPSNTRTRKNIEAFSVAIMRRILNEKIDSDALILSRNGVTWFML